MASRGEGKIGTKAAARMVVRKAEEGVTLAEEAEEAAIVAAGEAQAEVVLAVREAQEEVMPAAREAQGEGPVMQVAQEAPSKPSFLRWLLPVGAMSLGLCAFATSVQSEPAARVQIDQDLFQAYLNKPAPKAFAVDPATGRAWYAWGYPTLEEARAIALKECGQECTIYAENNTIVWIPTRSEEAVSAPVEPGIALQGDLPLDPAGMASFEEYKKRPLPKAFAFSPETGQTWSAWGYEGSSHNQQIALSKCESFGSPCSLLAIDNEVVWRAEATPTQPHFMQPLLVEPREGTLVVVENARMRTLPTAASRTIGRLEQGAQVQVTGKVRGIEWYRVALADAQEAFVYAPLLAGEPKSPSGTSTNALPGWRLISDLRHRAEAGEAEAQFQLGMRYDHGDGVERDGYEARYWFEQAADQGHPLAAYHLGLAYELGDGVDIDLCRAVELFEVSGAAGHDVSVRKLERYRPACLKDMESDEAVTAG